MDPELVRLVTEAMTAAGPPPPFPEPFPVEGEDEGHWVSRVARMRARHDALVIASARLEGGPDLTTPVTQMASVTYHDIETADDVISARVYTPTGDGPFGAVLFLHGGGWWMAGGAVGFEFNDATCRATAEALSSVVVNLDYRLAPEVRHPAQLDDAYAGLQWIVAHAAELDVDPARIAVYGISSGGNVAAALALAARDRGGPALCAQILVAPALDLTGTGPGLADDPAFAAAIQLLRAYYGGTETDFAQPYLSPLVAEDLSGLPPAVIVTGEFDQLGPGARAYAQRLNDAGISAVNLHYPMTHGIATPETRARLDAELLDAAAALMAVPQRT